MIPTAVYAEMTPNPKTMKFVVDRLLISGGEAVEYTSQAETKGSSTLAEALFNFPFVQGVFIMSNFVTVVKTDAIDWDMIVYELREFIREFMSNNETAVQQLPQKKAVEKTSEMIAGSIEEEPVVPSEYDEQIKAILEEYVRPAVEGDGGLIDFKSFKEGVVTVTLRGSCSGCPSSMQTLKGGIETMLVQMVPAVKTVVAEAL
jgi:NFU1 iron-sulfur cluster scaffold homolog, mitochondrial